MTKKALYVTMKSKPGKEQELARFLTEGLQIVEAEPATIAWFAVQIDASTFAIFDAFPDDAGRDAHLKGQLASALMAKASELLSGPPKIEKIDVLAAKLPQPQRASKVAGAEMTIPLQVGSELRIRNTGENVIDNPEIELALVPKAADAVVVYHYD
ncbi:MAG: antibiotic biosynthesis monooxygenase, partial [Candidatus Solibacter sp.]|nr:antibiotic biosynthesis monooxygenase [Candidatus Solibacter sp.]